MLPGGAEALAAHVQAAAIPNTAVFEISATAPSATVAVRMVNDVAYAFVGWNTANQQNYFTQTRSNLTGQLSSLAVQIAQVEDQINALQPAVLTVQQSAKLTALRNQDTQLHAQYTTLQNALQEAITAQAQVGGTLYVNRRAWKPSPSRARISSPAGARRRGRPDRGSGGLDPPVLSERRAQHTGAGATSDRPGHRGSCCFVDPPRARAWSPQR